MRTSTHLNTVKISIINLAIAASVLLSAKEARVWAVEPMQLKNDSPELFDTFRFQTLMCDNECVEGTACPASLKDGFECKLDLHPECVICCKDDINITRGMGGKNKGVRRRLGSKDVDCDKTCSIDLFNPFFPTIC